MDKIFSIKNLMIVALFMGFVVAFEVGMLLSLQNRPKVAGTHTSVDLAAELETLRRELAAKEQELLNLAEQQVELESKSGNVVELSARERQIRGEIQSLETRLASLRVVPKVYPFKVPSEGTLGAQPGSYLGQLPGMVHRGVDIWTTLANGGRIGSHKGNPVYTACSGKVISIVPENGGLTIDCDEIPASFDVPEHKVYTHYAHMGHADTKELFIVVEKGSRVKAGDLIGYQGDLSSYFPDMRNVHLHFSIFTGNSETDPAGGAVNPCLYIGGNCQQKGTVFRVAN